MDQYIYIVIQRYCAGSDEIISNVQAFSNRDKADKDCEKHNEASKGNTNYYVEMLKLY